MATREVQMGAKAGRKGARSYNLLTYGVGAWRKYLDKTRRKSAKKKAIEEQSYCQDHSVDETCSYCHDIRTFYIDTTDE
jgi:hypothetical protein